MIEEFLKKLNTSTKLFYATGNLGYGTLTQTLTTFVMFFGTSVLGIKGTLVGIAIALSAFWDGISDPLVGYLSDITKNKFFGKRLGYLFFGCIAMAVFNILLWNVPSAFGEYGKFFWLLFMLLGLETASTCFATPYVALGIDLAPGYNEQSTLQGFKTVFFIVGMILPSLFMFLFMPANVPNSTTNQQGYIYISYITSVLTLVCGMIAVFGTIKRTKQMPKFAKRAKEKNAFFKVFLNFFVTLKQKNYGAIIISYSVALISSAFLTSVGLHLFTYAFHFNSKQIPIMMMCIFACAIISQFFWVTLSNKIDKKPALKWAYFTILIGIFLSFWVFLFRDLMGAEMSFYVLLPCICVCGFGTGALYTLPMSMFADVVNIEKLKTGENKSATYSGYMTLAYNIANSFALLIVGVLLDIIKFSPTSPVQPLVVQNKLGFLVFGGCAVCIVLAMLTLSPYSIKRSDVLKQQLLAKQKKVSVAEIKIKTEEREMFRG